MHSLSSYKHHWTVLFLFLPIIIFYGCSDDSTTSPDELPAEEFQYVLPEEAGYSSDSLAIVEQMCEDSGYDAMMAVSNGKVFFSWGEVERNFWCHSIRKPMLSALIGIHQGVDGVDLEANLADLGINDIEPSLTEEELQATVRQLMQSRSGVYHPAAGETQEMRDTRPPRGKARIDPLQQGTGHRGVSKTDVPKSYHSWLPPPPVGGWVSNRNAAVVPRHAMLITSVTKQPRQ